jgi:16S rRNA (cytosine1402-N4)-methyltransferase
LKFEIKLHLKLILKKLKTNTRKQQKDCIAAMSNKHIPVLLNEVITSLNIKKNGIYVDATAGRGGHSEEILKCLKSGKLICIDQDSEAIEYLKEKFLGKDVLVLKANFRNLKEVLKQNGIEKVDGILADLGVSSPQLDDLERGFSYHNESKIDMRMDQESKIDAA